MVKKIVATDNAFVPEKDEDECTNSLWQKESLRIFEKTGPLATPGMTNGSRRLDDKLSGHSNNQPMSEEYNMRKAKERRRKVAHRAKEKKKECVDNIMLDENY